jgi:hypothetical protein
LEKVRVMEMEKVSATGMVKELGLGLEKVRV